MITHNKFSFPIDYSMCPTCTSHGQHLAYCTHWLSHPLCQHHCIRIRLRQQYTRTSTNMSHTSRRALNERDLHGQRRMASSIGRNSSMCHASRQSMSTSYRTSMTIQWQDTQGSNAHAISSWTSIIGPPFRRISRFMSKDVTDISKRNLGRCLATPPSTLMLFS